MRVLYGAGLDVEGGLVNDTLGDEFQDGEEDNKQKRDAEEYPNERGDDEPTTLIER